MGPLRKPLQHLQVGTELSKAQQQSNLIISDGLVKLIKPLHENKQLVKTESDTLQKREDSLVTQCNESKCEAHAKDPKSSIVNKSSEQIGSSANNDRVENSIKNIPPHLVPRPLATDDISKKDLIDWMTADNPPESCWKELAEQRRLALEEALSENEELVLQLEAKNLEIDQLRETVESQKEAINGLNEKIKEDGKEMEILRVMANEAERLTNILNDLLEGPEEEDKTTDSLSKA